MVAHATLSVLQAEVDRAFIVQKAPDSRDQFRRDSQACSLATFRLKACPDSRAVAFHCAVRVDAPKALRFATPPQRAAIGLDRASREPLIAIIDGRPRDS